MTLKVHSVTVFLLQSFGDLVHKPLLVDLTVEEGQRLKVIYGSSNGFHAVDVDSGAVYDIYLPTHVRDHLLSISFLCFLFFFVPPIHGRISNRTLTTGHVRESIEPISNGNCRVIPSDAYLSNGHPIPTQSPWQQLLPMNLSMLPSNNSHYFLALKHFQNKSR